jgi:hypothetical protein
MAFVAGHYAATYSAADIGTTKDGFTLKMVNHQEMITVDDFGDAPVDAVQRGTEYQLVLAWAEYDLIKPVIAGQQVFGGTKANVGKLLRPLSAQLVLTAVAGTPAATAGNIATLTATQAIVVSDVDILLAARHRHGPLTFHLFPNTSTNLAFTVT